MAQAQAVHHPGYGPRARLDSPAAPAIGAQLQAAPRLRDEKVSLVLKRLAGRAGLTVPTATPATRPVAASRPSCAAAGGWQRLDQVLRHVGRHLAQSPAARLGL